MRIIIFFFWLFYSKPARLFVTPNRNTCLSNIHYVQVTTEGLGRRSRNDLPQIVKDLSKLAKWSLNRF